jgi:hypothetical protein
MPIRLATMPIQTAPIQSGTNLTNLEFFQTNEPHAPLYLMSVCENGSVVRQTVAGSGDRYAGCFAMADAKQCEAAKSRIYPDTIALRGLVAVESTVHHSEFLCALSHKRC